MSLKLIFLLNKSVVKTYLNLDKMYVIIGLKFLGVNIMDIKNLRYFLTEHQECYFFTYNNNKLLIHPTINDYDLINKIYDDAKLMPDINDTNDKVKIKFNFYTYDENLYFKNELLTFIMASIDEDWDIVEGINLLTLKKHFWLKKDDIIFDLGLEILTNNKEYSKYFKEIKTIKNNDINSYLKEHNNLLKFYKPKSLFKKRNANFSINFIESIKEKFQENIDKQYILDADAINDIRAYILNDDLLRLRQVLCQKRTYELKSSKILLHPSVDTSILKEIEKTSQIVYDLMLEKYNMYFTYHVDTIYNCYALSIMFNLVNESFNLVQGGIPYTRTSFNIITNHFYQHSWLEKDNIVYDPALRIVVPKDLYYIFVQKQDVYTKQETENILRRIGFDLTHFRDFMDGKQIGNDERITSRLLINKIDSPENYEAGEKLISYVRAKVKENSRTNNSI